MRKIIVLTLASSLVLLGAGCSNASVQETSFEQSNFNPQPAAKSDGPAVVPAQPIVVAPVDSSTPTQAELSKMTPRERGMVRLHVISSITKLPVPNVPFVISHSSGGKNTNAEGWVEFGALQGNLYIPKMGGFMGSGLISTIGGDKDGNITVELVPDNE